MGSLAERAQAPIPEGLFKVSPTENQALNQAARKLGFKSNGQDVATILPEAMVVSLITESRRAESESRNQRMISKFGLKDEMVKTLHALVPGVPFPFNTLVKAVNPDDTSESTAQFRTRKAIRILNNLLPIEEEQINTVRVGDIEYIVRTSLGDDTVPKNGDGHKKSRKSQDPDGLSPKEREVADLTAAGVPKVEVIRKVWGENEFGNQYYSVVIGKINKKLEAQGKTSLTIKDEVGLTKNERKIANLFLVECLDKREASVRAWGKSGRTEDIKINRYLRHINAKLEAIGLPRIFVPRLSGKRK